METVEVNYVAVIVAALVPMFLGAAWYSRSLFGSMWMQAVGKTEADLGRANIGYAIAALASLVMAYVLARFVEHADASGIVDGLLIGALAWVGFVATTAAVNGIFAGRPWMLWTIDAGYHLVSLLVMGAILGAWS